MLRNLILAAASGSSAVLANPTNIWHMEEPSGSIVASSNNGVTLTGAGAMSVAAGPAKFGSRCFQLSDNYGTASFGTTDDLVFDGDFTFELWMLSSRNASLERFMTLGNFAINYQALFDGWASPIKLLYKGTNVLISGGTTKTYVYKHMAWTRKDGVNRLFFDGLMNGTYYNTDVVSLSNAIIGGGNPVFNGTIDEVRSKKGICLYDANFSVPTNPFVS